MPGRALLGHKYGWRRTAARTPHRRERGTFICGNGSRYASRCLPRGVLDPDHTLTSDVTSNQARGPDRVTKRQLLSTNGENLPRSLDTAGDSQLRNRVIQKASSGPVGHGLRKAMGTGWRQWSMKKEVSKEARSVCRWRVGRAMPGIACIVVASCRVIGSAARAP